MCNVTYANYFFSFFLQNVTAQCQTRPELKPQDLRQDKIIHVHIFQAVTTSKNLVEYHRKSDGKTNKKTLRCIFSGKNRFGKIESCNL